MKLVVAIIRTHKLDDTRGALASLGGTGMTIMDSKGFGRQKGQLEQYRGAETDVDYVARIKLEMVVPDDRVDQTIATIIKSNHTGKIGDGKIFVYSPVSVMRIRTGETDDAAL